MYTGTCASEKTCGWRGQEQPAKMGKPHLEWKERHIYLLDVNFDILKIDPGLRSMKSLMITKVVAWYEPELSSSTSRNNICLAPPASVNCHSPRFDPRTHCSAHDTKPHQKVWDSSAAAHLTSTPFISEILQQAVYNGRGSNYSFVLLLACHIQCRHIAAV